MGDSTKTSESPASNDTVNLCKQTAYPGDDELEALEKEIMLKWNLDQPPDVQTGTCTNSEESKKNLDLTKQALAAGKQCDALGYIELALEADSLNAALWLQRATVLIALGDFREAFRSCCAFEPAERGADLWKVGGSILDKLGLPVTAEIWFRHATKRATPGDNSAAILFQKIRAKRLYQPLTQGMPVEVSFTSQGRTILATKAIKKGEVIFSDKPMLLAQTLPTLAFPCCANCVKSLISPDDVFTAQELQEPQLKKAVKKFWPMRERVPCACGHETYCSEACKEEAWESNHRLICANVNPAMQKLVDVCETYKRLSSTDCSAFDGWWSASFSPVLLAKLWAQIVCGALTLAKQGERSNPSARDWALARAPYRRFIAYGSSNNADNFYKMHQLMADIFKDLGDGLSYNITREEFAGRYLQLACNTQSFSDLDNPMGHLCRGLHADPQLRHLVSFCRDKPHEGDFAGLFPLHACMNHSCANNAFVGDGKTPDGRPGCHVTAKRNIAPGDEICNQYIDVTVGRRERQYLLYRSYNFWCKCMRCQFEGNGPTSCTECDTQTPEEKPFPKCSRCKKAWYCSATCQKKAWKKGHKKICGLQI